MRRKNLKQILPVAKNSKGRRESLEAFSTHIKQLETIRRNTQPSLLIPEETLSLIEKLQEPQNPSVMEELIHPPIPSNYTIIKLPEKQIKPQVYTEYIPQVVPLTAKVSVVPKPMKYFIS